MTGEMIRSDVTAEAYPLHFAIAGAVGGTVEPFDQYQGPYVCVGGDVRIGSGAYALAPRGFGVVRLWVCSNDGGGCFIYNEANEQQSENFWWDDSESAIEAAKSVLAS